MSKHPNIACHQTLLLVCNTVSRYIIKTSCKLLAKKGDREIKQCYTFSQNKKKHPEIYTLGTLSNRQDFCVLEKALRTSLHRCPVSQSVVSVLSLFISTYFRVSGDRKNHRSCSDQLCKDMKIKPWGRRARCLCVHQLFTAQEMQSVGEFKQGGRSDSKVRTSHSCVCEEMVCQLQSRL